MRSGKTETGNDFANYRNFTKTGIKYEDLNADGSKNGDDAGLQGWTISAFVDSNSDGTLQQSEITVGAADTDTTDENGAYSLSLKPGQQYIVVETSQANWFESPDDETVVVNSSAGTPLGGYGKYGYVLPADAVRSGKTETGNDFANYRNATKSGFKYNDLNGSRTWDAGQSGQPGEPRLAGWTIFIDANGNNQLDTGEVSTTTAADGTYSFSLRPGAYTFQEVNQVGWVQTQGGYTETLESGQVSANNNFGNWQPGVCGLTPGFWGQHLWAWDGDPLSDGPSDQQGRTLASKLVADKVLTGEDVLRAVDSNRDGKIDKYDVPGVLVGDVDKDGCRGPGETTIFFRLEDARNLINASTNLINSDQRAKMSRDAIAAQLNVLNGATVDTGVQDLITGAARWLTGVDPYDGFSPSGSVDQGNQAGSPLLANDGIADVRYKNKAFDGFYGSVVRANSPAWQQGRSWRGQTLSGSAIHEMLDDFNNCVMITGMDKATRQTLVMALAGDGNDGNFQDDRAIGIGRLTNFGEFVATANLV